MTEDVEPGPGRRRPRWLVPAVVVAGGIVVVSVAAIAATGGDGGDRGDEVSTGASEAGPLLDTRWWLVGATDGRKEVPVPTTGTPYLGLEFLGSAECAAEDEADGLCYGGPQMVASDACNGVSRKVTVVGDTVRLGDDFGAHTAMACSDRLTTLLQDFFAADEFTYALDAGGLRLRSVAGDVVLTYREMDGPFGPTASLVVDEGRSEAGAYRLVWGDGGLTVEVAEGSGGGRPGSAFVGTDPGRVNAMRVDAQGREYLFGVVPAAATRVVYEPAGGAAEEIEVRDVGDDEFAVVGQFVEAVPERWELVAYDASSHELDRLRWG